jgi:hypothetical protein
LGVSNSLDFDNADGGSTSNCLSARNLIIPISEEGLVDSWSFDLGDVDVESKRLLAEAIGTPYEDDDDYIDIPDSIRQVTELFDWEVEGLRERMVEAGVVAP